MSDIIKKEKMNPVVDRKKQTQQDDATRQFILDYTVSPIDPKLLLRNVYRAAKRYNANQDNQELKKQLLARVTEALPVVATDSHYALARATIEELRPFVIEFANQIIAEYDCKTATEKALAETIAAAYIRILEFTGYMTRMVRDKYCSMTLSGAYKVASQELDRANRHFINAIATLKQIKTPAMSIQVKATNAFVAQNQQVNVASHEPSVGNEKIYENVNPK